MHGKEHKKFRTHLVFTPSVQGVAVVSRQRGRESSWQHDCTKGIREPWEIYNNVQYCQLLSRHSKWKKNVKQIITTWGIQSCKLQMRVSNSEYPNMFFVSDSEHILLPYKCLKYNTILYLYLQ